jgi:hypothetical protein
MSCYRQHQTRPRCPSLFSQAVAAASDNRRLSITALYSSLIWSHGIESSESNMASHTTLALLWAVVALLGGLDWAGGRAAGGVADG